MIAALCAAACCAAAAWVLRALKQPPAPHKPKQTKALLATYALRLLLAFCARLDRELPAPFQPLLEDPDSVKPVSEAVWFAVCVESGGEGREWKAAALVC
jgi:hypothetical protein